MLPRRLRLTRNTFPGRSAHRAASSSFSLSFSPSPEGGCAAVVSKAVARRSVDRHLLKRRMLKVMGPWCSKGRALVAYARSGATKLSFRELSAELTALLTRLPKN